MCVPLWRDSGGGGVGGVGGVGWGGGGAGGDGDDGCKREVGVMVAKL
jgi:hypothetical protein